MTAEFRRDRDGNLFMLVRADTTTEATMLADVAKQFGINIELDSDPTQGVLYSKETR